MSQIDLEGHPIHTRALAVTVSAAAESCWEVTAYVLDLRQRGIVPVGSELQGTGIIHHMELRALINPVSAKIIALEPRQPTVAFESGPSTRGESCRDPSLRLAALVGARLDAEFSSKLRDSFGGLLGCSHLLTLIQFVVPPVMALLDDDGARAGAHAVGQRLFRRDLIFDGHEIEEGRLALGLQFADLKFQPTPAECLPMARFDAQYELRLRLDLEGWPSIIQKITGGQRRRRQVDFADAEWEDAALLLESARGLSLGKGAAAEVSRRLPDQPEAREALLMVAPALIQCRAAFPDKWLNQVATAPGHPGLIGMPDSCYMWRRDGALAKVRDAVSGARLGR